MAGLLGLGYAAYIAIDTQAYQAIEHRRLERPRSDPSPSRHPIADGGVIGKIEIPRVGLRAIVAQGDSAAVLQRAVGHTSRSRRFPASLAMWCSRAIATPSSGH
jgi:sortase (surface protein transpeptidase)